MNNSSSKKSDPLSELNAKLKTCDSEIQKFVTALKAKNLKLQDQIAELQVKNIFIGKKKAEYLKLQKQIVELQVENVTLKDRIKILEKEVLKPPVNIKLVDEYIKPNHS